MCRRYGVRRLEVFGSAARGEAFDPAIPGLSPLEQYFGLAEALGRLLGRHVDLIEAGALCNPFVLASVNQAREVVYAS